MLTKDKIEVTAEDIRLGKPSDPERCPAARSFRRSHRKAGLTAAVTLWDITVRDKSSGNIIATLKMTDRLRGHISDIDICEFETPEPFTIAINQEKGQADVLAND